MFTGIVQGVATVAAMADRTGLRTLELDFGHPDHVKNLAVGASVSVDGVCLTVTQLKGATGARFDVMQQSLALTTLGGLLEGDHVNFERAAKASDEVGGHALSGHIDTQATVLDVRRPDNNHVMRIGVDAPWMRYLFAKGYVAVDGASLTIAEAHREADGSGWFEVWLIPETLRMTTFAAVLPGCRLNIEIDRATQVVVDTVRDAVTERLGVLAPALEQLLAERGITLEGLTGDKAKRLK